MRATIDLHEVENAFKNILGDLGKLTGLDRKAIIIAEAGSILKVAAGRTKVAKDLDRVDRNSRLQVLRALEYTSGIGPVTINVGVRGKAGRVWYKTKKGKYRMAFGPGNLTGPPVNYHWKDSDWIDIKEAAEDYRAAAARKIPLGRRSVGLARQSWVQIADNLGIKLESVPGSGASASAISKARNAIASTGRPYINGFAQQYANANEFFVDLVNTLPYGRKAGLDSILTSAVNGRVKFFERNVALGVFQSQQAIAKKYPGLYVRLG